jgi:hypothetical protein
MLRQLIAEAVFLQNLFSAPAVGAVKLGDQRELFINANLVNTVFVAVQWKCAAVTAETLAFDGIHDEIGSKNMKWVRVVCHAGTITLKWL